MSKLTLLNLEQPKTIKASSGAPVVFGFDNPEQFFELFHGIKTASGRQVSYDQAMRCSAVLTCIRILSEDIASLPLIVKQKKSSGAVDAVDHAAYRLLKLAPNEFQTSFEVREHMMLDLLLTGYFYNWQKRNGVGRLVEIVPIPARSIAFQKQLPDGTLTWSCGQPGFPNTFAHWDLWRGNILNHHIIGGHSLVLLAREAIGLALAAEEQGARLFSNGIQTAVSFSTDNELDADTRAQLKESLHTANAGSGNAWKALILDNGLKAEKIGLTAEESQFMESRHYQLADIARLFRVPGVMLGLNDKTNTFAAAEQFFQAYSKHTLGPWTRRIEETAARDLLLKRESDYFIQHDYSQLLRADLKTRYDSYKTAIEGGFMQPREARIAENWEEVKGLDYTLAPVTYALMRDGVLEAVPSSRGGPSQETETTGKTPAKPSETPAQPMQNGNKLAQRVAENVVRSEQRQFARMRVSEAAIASFAAWHLEKVMDITGASAEAAQGYSAWRLDNRSAHDEAISRIVTLCLEALL